VSACRQGAGREASQEETEVRVGFTVTKKVGNAVVRNRVKRRLRAAAAEVFPRLGRADTDYVVIGRLATLTRPFPALLQDLEQAVEKLGRRSDAEAAATAKPKPANTGEASR
jgi:ribonuclease P protein component